MDRRTPSRYIKQKQKKEKEAKVAALLQSVPSIDSFFKKEVASCSSEEAPVASASSSANVSNEADCETTSPACEPELPESLSPPPGASSATCDTVTEVSATSSSTTHDSRGNINDSSLWGTIDERLRTALWRKIMEF
ncbi:UNVERIFIED_CONTAM: hypothetical protein FKN15_037403 [Acipenser sinensis]